MTTRTFDVLAAVTILGALTATAVADDERIPEGIAMAPLAQPTTPHQYALAVNEPFGWDGRAVGISGYGGIDEHQAIHINFATYDPGFSPLQAIVTAHEGGDASGLSGRTTDVGVAWMYFPRALYDGFSIETGALGRWTNSTDDEEYPTMETDRRQTFEIAGRALIGWSWIVSRRAFFSLQAGASVGKEFGDAQVTPYDDKTIASHVHQTDVGFESIARFGFAFDPE